SLQNVVKSALEGQHGEILLEREGRTYQVKANAVLRDANVRGAILLSFDVTEENLAEQHRREFSANVSHELKSPLQTIMGSAELMESGLVKEEDRPMFMGRIRSEAERLVVLIDDIIRLSQLDEGGEFPVEEIDLLAMAKEIKDDLDEKAEKRNVTIAVAGESVSMHGVRRLVNEIIYNLCDNALKYNKEYGTVTMVVRKDEDYAVLTVADTGIGIPEEHLDRIFERFYRVDKSHSRETGGTGLGLSIVKHAAQFHNAIIDVKSSDGKGTTFTVKFPL
ncbi:MAG: two-component sensor histidine kinase, partial [Firmicutes bacterium]|nr:two-component sensor histidine kinase [Bacillota bacterium]